MKIKQERIYLRAEEELKERLAKAAEVVDAPASQIIREAIIEKLAKLSRKHPELQEVAIK